MEDEHKIMGNYTARNGNNSNLIKKLEGEWVRISTITNRHFIGKLHLDHFNLYLLLSIVNEATTEKPKYRLEEEFGTLIKKHTCVSIEHITEEYVNDFLTKYNGNKNLIETSS